jgi:hypothetical protein
MLRRSRESFRKCRLNSTTIKTVGTSHGVTVGRDVLIPCCDNSGMGVSERLDASSSHLNLTYANEAVFPFTDNYKNKRRALDSDTTLL